MKLNYKRTICLGLAFLSISSFWQLYDNIIPLLLKNTFLLKETKTGVIMAMDNVLALFLLPLFGALSDKVNTKFGKRTPFIVIGTFLAVSFMILISIAGVKGNLILFLIFLGIVLISMGIYRSPAVALMPDLTPKPLRSKANALINLMGAVGGVYTLVVIRLLVKNDGKHNYLPVFIAVAGLMILAVVILLLTINEKKLAEQLKKEEIIFDGQEKDTSHNVVPSNADRVKTSEKMPKEVRKSFLFMLASIFLWFTAYNAVTTAYSRYAEVVWNLKAGGFADALLVAMIAAILSFIPIGHISSSIGRKKTILAGVLIMTVSYFSGFLFVEYSWLISIVFAFTGIGWAAINVNSYPMIVEMSRASDVGKYTGLYYTFSMSAQIMTPILSGMLLQNISYRTLFPYAVFFSLASFITMLFVRHGDTRPIKRRGVLENYDTED